MMKNKIHDKFLINFKHVKEIIAIDIPNNDGCIKKEDLKKIIEKTGIKSKTSNSVQEAVKYISSKDKQSIITILGSIYLIGEVLNLN
jgi:folylpolyglutamate synthase/dihydropteroate synthase